MNRIITFEVDEKLYANFRIALLSSYKTEKEVINEAIQTFTFEQLTRIAKESSLRYTKSFPYTTHEKIMLLKRIKAETHQSWINLRKAVYKEKRWRYSFGTLNVEASSVSFLNKVKNECNMTTDEILQYLNEEKLGIE